MPLWVTRFWRVAFLRQRKNAECINRGLRSPRALPWAMGNIWAYSPPQSFTGRLCKLVHIHAPLAAARHSPTKRVCRSLRSPCTHCLFLNMVDRIINQIFNKYGITKIQPFRTEPHCGGVPPWSYDPKRDCKEVWRIGEHLKRLGEPLQPDSGETRNFAARIEAISDYARNE